VDVSNEAKAAISGVSFAMLGVGALVARGNATATLANSTLAGPMAPSYCPSSQISVADNAAVSVDSVRVKVRDALAGSLACAEISEAELAEIAALHYEMLAQYMRRDLPGYFRLNQAIHAAIVAAARNPILAATYQSLAARIRRARYFANLSDERWQHAVAEHEAILQTLQARDGPRLARLLEEHLHNKSVVLRGELP